MSGSKSVANMPLVPCLSATRSPAAPCTTQPAQAASYSGSFCASKPPMMPDSTSPMPPESCRRCRRRRSPSAPAHRRSACRRLSAPPRRRSAPSACARQVSDHSMSAVLQLNSRAASPGCGVITRFCRFSGFNASKFSASASHKAGLSLVCSMFKAFFPIQPGPAPGQSPAHPPIASPATASPRPAPAPSAPAWPPAAVQHVQCE